MRTFWGPSESFFASTIPIMWPPQTMSELYSHLHEELQMRLEEAERVGYGFDLPKIAVAPNAPKMCAKSKAELAA
jgi:hypothetical protein